MSGFNETKSVPAWYWLAAGFALLWETLGCYMYVTHVTTNVAALPLDQRAIFQATPGWSTAAFAVAVWVGLIGAILLLLRRRHSVTALGISLIAVVVQFSALMLDPQLSSLISSDMFLGPIVIALLCYGVFQFSLFARKNGWLRR